MLSNGKGESINEKNPEKLNVFRGSPDGFVTEIYPVGTRNNSENTGQTAVSEIPGAQAGAIGFDSDLQGLIDAWPLLSETTKRKILRDVQRALK